MACSLCFEDKWGTALAIVLKTIIFIVLALARDSLVLSSCQNS